MEEYKVINSFTRKPSLAQIVSYIVITLQTCIFYVMVRPNIDNFTAKTILTVLFTISLFVCVLSSFFCSYIDPSDTVMIHCKNRQKSKIKFSLSELLFCDYCQAYVTPDARHCRQCNRCVQNFDHHCMWINNCVGSKNYRVFMIMICSTLSNLAIFVCGVIVLSVQNRWNNFFGLIVTSWVALVIVFILFVLLFNLNLLHFYLICKGYTTYQFIMARKQNQRLQKQKQAQKGKDKDKQEQRKKIQKQKEQESEIKGKSLRKESNPQYEQNSVNFLLSNSKKTPQKNMKYEHDDKEDTNSHINLISQIKTNSIKVSHKNQSHISNQSNQKQKHVFKGFQEKSQKSEYQSVQIAHQADLKEVHNNKKVSESDNKQQKLESSEGSQQIRISQFFIRNKSFSLLISNQKVQKPHKAALEMSLDDEMLGKEGKTKQNKGSSFHSPSKSKEHKNKALKSISKN